MIAKEGWFTRRKYAGWGFFPSSWQGWIYLVVLVLPFAVMSALKASAETQLTVTAIWAVVVVVAFVDIVKSIRKDEREMVHEAIAERNALWAVIAALTAGVGYQAASGVVRGVWDVDPVILIALVVGVVVKAISNIYLDRKD